MALFFKNFSLAAIRNGESTPILDAIVFKKIRALLGGSMRLMLSGGAPLSKETHDFMRVCVGAPLLQGYGLTEVAACATVMDMEDMATDQVGNPNQVKENFFLESFFTVFENRRKCLIQHCERSELFTLFESV